MKPAFLCLVLLGVCAANAADWPTWRGPNRDGVSSETGLLTEWPAAGPKKRWTATEAGLGYSSFAVVGNRLYTMGADVTNEYLIAFDATSGKKIWEVSVGERLQNNWGDGPRSTPAVSGNMIGKTPNWGYAESPFIDGSTVLCTPGRDAGTVVAFDLQSGKKLWQSSDITERAHYSSIIAADHYGQNQYIQLTKEKVFGLDSKGKLLWQADWPGRTAVIPTPIYHDGRVYVTSGYGVGCMMLKIDRENNVETAYENKVMKNQHGGVIRLGSQIYGYSDGPGWICQDIESGEMIWNEKRKQGKGSVTFAEGMLYCFDQNAGTCVLASASPEGWQEHGRFTLEPQTDQRSPKGKIWTHPVVANGRLYLRDQEIICCYDIKAP